jgi:hypothetical protein
MHSMTSHPQEDLPRMKENKYKKLASQSAGFYLRKILKDPKRIIFKVIRSTALF